jgi:hypothetical protein
MDKMKPRRAKTMTQLITHEEIEMPAWNEHAFIASELRSMGYPVSSWKPTDHRLIRLACMGYNPSLLGLRVEVACEQAHIKRPPGFSPSNIAHASRNKVISLARRVGVPERWLLTGRLWETVEENVGPITANYQRPGGFPEFLRPYVDLALDAEAIVGLVNWYSDKRSVNSPRWSAWEYIEEALNILRKAKETESAYLECKRKQKDHVKGAEWVWESSVDRFYKMRSDGECSHFSKAIPNLPWVGSVLPLIWQAEDAWQKRDHHLTVTREELEWIIHGYCDGVLVPAQRDKSSFWKDEIATDPGMLDRMRSLHQKLFTALDCEPLPEPSGRERRGSGRKRKPQ